MKVGAKMTIFKFGKTKETFEFDWTEGIQRLVKNKWYERSHWTYKVNRGWLIKRGIEAFHWSIFPRGKFLWEISKRFRVDPEVFPKKKKAAKTL